MTPQQLSDLLLWVEQYAAGVDDLDEQTVAAVLAVYAGVNFYDKAEVAAAAEQAADLSDTASLMMAGLAAQYVSTVTSLITDRDVPAPAVLLAPLRNGANMRQVYARPAKLFRRQVAKGVAPAAAFEQAMRLVGTLTTTNTKLAARDAWTKSLGALEAEYGITGYRRVVHPELARTGSCALCIVASDQVYRSGMLMPLHGGCNCTVLPIIGAAGGEGDPGNSLNGMSVGDFTGLADSTHGWDLKKVRVEIREHGEYGPTLTDASQRFTSWEDLAPASLAA